MVSAHFWGFFFLIKPHQILKWTHWAHVSKKGKDYASGRYSVSVAFVSQGVSPLDWKRNAEN